MVSKKITDSWLAELDPALHEIAETLRMVVLEADPDISEAIKWGNPTYDKNGKVCYLSATKGYVSLGFFNGASLTDPEGRVEGTGKKMRHIKVRSLADIQPEQYASWVREAVALNQRESV
jgi:hypothetical protein